VRRQPPRSLRLGLATALTLLCAVGAGAQESELARVEALNSQASQYFRERRYEDAIASIREALAIREKVLGPDHLDVANSLNILGLLYVNQGRYAEAEPLYQRSLAIREKALGADHAEVARVLNNLGTSYIKQGRYTDAEPCFKRSLIILERTFGPEHGDVATALGNLGLLYSNQGRYAEAEPLYLRELAIREKALGPDHPNLATGLNNLASLYTYEGRYADAEPIYKRSLALKEKAFGPEHPDVANSLSNLAHLYSAQGRAGEAEALYRRTLAMREKLFGPEHPDVALSLNNLAELYREQGRYPEAGALFSRSLAIREKVLGSEHPDVALTINNLASLYDDQGRYEDAESLYKKSLAIRERALGPDHPDVAHSLNNLGVLYDRQGRYTEAEALYERSLAIWQKMLGPEHPALAINLNNLAGLHAKQNRYADAEPLYRRSLAVAEKALGPEHPDLITGLFNLAVVYRELRRIVDASAASGRAVEILSRRAAQAQDQRSDRETAERRRFRSVFLLHIALLHKQAEIGAEPAGDSFKAAQLASASSTAQAVAGMSARFASGTDALAGAVRERQDLAKGWQTLDTAILKAVSKPPSERDAEAEKQLRASLDDTSKKLDALDARIAKEFPEYAELSNPKPLSAEAAQALLAPGEALLIYLSADDVTWLWVLRRDRIAVRGIEIGAAALAHEVAALRGALDPDRNPDFAPFPAKDAYAIYQKLLGPALPLLDGVKNLLVVPDGALESLPLGVLVTKPPEHDPKTPADHRDIAWLARDYAITVLPAVASLRALRQPVKAPAAPAPFLGVGNPVLDGKPGSERGVKLASLFRGALANVDDLRHLEALPETADELRAVAKTLGAGDKDLLLGEKASEPVLRQTPLDHYRVIQFATHGLVSGDLPGLAEPALVLTPPKEATPDNDGLLTASKVATLKLNADWVVLSACNTAAGDGTPDAGGLSGLAKAFFYAGAKSLLVSHWKVPSNSTVKLMTDAFAELKKDPKIGRAEALRRAEMAMLDPKNPPEFAHPLAWAPFVLAGEGGAGR